MTPPTKQRGRKKKPNHSKKRAAEACSPPIRRSEDTFIDWELAQEDVPSEDVLDGADLTDTGSLFEAVETFCWLLESGAFISWEAVIREEQGLPLSAIQQSRLDDLISFSDEADDRILYIDEMPRPNEPWYITLHHLATALRVPAVRTAGMYEDVQITGWQQIEELLEQYGEGLSLPAGAKRPIDAVVPDLLHSLRIQGCLDHLAGIGQELGGVLSLSDKAEQDRVDLLIGSLSDCRESVEFLGLTLERLAQRVELPPGEGALLEALLVDRLGPLARNEPLAGKLPPSPPR